MQVRASVPTATCMASFILKTLTICSQWKTKCTHLIYTIIQEGNTKGKGYVQTVVAHRNQIKMVKSMKDFGLRALSYSTLCYFTWPLWISQVVCKNECLEPHSTPCWGIFEKIIKWTYIKKFMQIIFSNLWRLKKCLAEV